METRNFRDRMDAAEKLAEKLSDYAFENPLVLGIPRGGVPMAAMLADSLNGDLDVILVHKIGAPFNREYAVGAVSEFGSIYRSEEIDESWFSQEYFQYEAQKELEELQNRRRTYSPLRPPISPSGRTVILVDDGIATGSTMLSAARTIREHEAQKTIIAAPVASQGAMNLLEGEADETVVLAVPEEFYAISLFYDQFPQVTDDEVMQLLSERGRRANGGEEAA